MPDYRNMTAREALRLAKDVSGMTSEAIAAKAGISGHVMKRYLKQEDGYLPGIEVVVPLCRAMGNTILLQWLEAQFESEPEIEPAKSRADVLTAVARIAATLGDCQRTLAENETIRPETAREIRSILKDASLECQMAAAMLASLAGAKGIDEAEPLASLKRERKPWWRVWE